MPSLEPVPGVVRVAFRGTAAGQGVVNVFHLAVTTFPLSQIGIDDLAGEAKAAYETNLVPRLQGAWSGDTVTAVDLSSDIGATSQLPLAGSPGAPALTSPNSLACCITWKINRHYRGGHPRTYLGPVPASQLENQTTFAATFITLVTNSAIAFRNAMNSMSGPYGTTQMVAVHRIRNGEVLADPLVSPIVGSAVDSRIDTMRRRLGPDR